MRAFLTLACFVAYTAASGFSLEAQRRGGGPVDAAAARAANAPLVGAWTLVGQPAGNLGYLVYDPAGFMTMAVQAAGRPDVGDRAYTPQDARAALDSYTALWGPFIADAARGAVTHQTFGALDPATSGLDVANGFTREGNRLTLRASPRAPGRASRLPDLTWERLPDLPTLTPTHRKLIGIWRFVSWDSRTGNGPANALSPGMTGFITYTASGHVIVHMMYPYRRRPVGPSPTPDESMAEYRGYTGYFGHYTVNEAENYVVHHIDATLNSGVVGTDFQRYLEFTGKRLTLKPPATKGPNGEVQTRLTWERVSD
jgi:hypothetical protein